MTLQLCALISVLLYQFLNLLVLPLARRLHHPRQRRPRHRGVVLTVLSVTELFRQHDLFDERVSPVTVFLCHTDDLIKRDAVVRVQLAAEGIGEELAGEILGNVVAVQLEQEYLHLARRLKRFTVGHHAGGNDRCFIRILYAPITELGEVFQSKPERIDLLVAGIANGLRDMLLQQLRDGRIALDVQCLAGFFDRWHILGRFHRLADQRVQHPHTAPDRAGARLRGRHPHDGSTGDDATLAVALALDKDRRIVSQLSVAAFALARSENIRVLSVHCGGISRRVTLALGLERAGPLVKPVALHQLQHAAVLSESVHR